MTHQSRQNGLQPLGPEEKLLLSCAHLRPEPATAARIRSLLAVELDWAELLTLADQHKMRPLLFWNLQGIWPESVPPARLAQLREDFYANDWLNLHLSRELVKIVKLFEGHGIRTIPFKGVVLATSVYGQLSVRQAGDIDILVSPADVLTAKSLLLAEGFQAARMSKAEETAYLQTANHFRLLRTETRTPVELHWDLTPRGLPHRADFEQLWLRTETVDLPDASVSTLSAEDLLAYLCVHLVKHQWPRLRWLVDIAELIRLRQEELDWDRLMSRVPLGGSRRMFWLALFLVHSLLEAPLPPVIMTAVEGDPRLRPLAKRLCGRLFEAETRTPEAAWQRYRFQLAALDTVHEKVGYIHHLLTPYHIQPAHLSLPYSFYSLYYFTRPLRFVFKYGQSRLRNLVYRETE